VGVLNELVVLTGRFSSSKLNDQALVRAKKKDGSCNNGLEVVELTGWSKGGKREGEGGGGRGREGKGGNSHVKRTDLLVGNFENNPALQGTKVFLGAA